MEDFYREFLNLRFGQQHIRPLRFFVILEIGQVVLGSLLAFRDGSQSLLGFAKRVGDSGRFYLIEYRANILKTDADRGAARLTFFAVFSNVVSLHVQLVQNRADYLFVH